MNAESLREDFRSRISEKIDLRPQGHERFQVSTPFRFEDGDHFSIVLKREGDRWIFTDEASTIMHLSYWLDTEVIESGKRKEIVESSLSAFDVENRDGELIIPVPEGRFGDALFGFVQALIKITDITFLSRELVRSAFMDDLKAFLKAKVPVDRLEFNWHHERDSGEKYPVDFRINHRKRPLLIYGIPNEDKLKDAQISLLTFETWGMKFDSCAVFENQESIPRKPLARFSDIIGKAFSSLDDNKERIGVFLEDILQEEAPSV
jgi:hypothetical protein